MTEENKEPTLQEIMALAQQALATAEEAKTAAEAREGVQETVEAEAEKKGFDISEEQAQMIAGITIAELEKRGAFGDSAPVVEDAPPASGEDPPAGGGEQPAGGASPPLENAPRRPSLAERFRGGS